MPPIIFASVQLLSKGCAFHMYSLNGIGVVWLNFCRNTIFSYFNRAPGKRGYYG